MFLRRVLDCINRLMQPSHRRRLSSRFMQISPGGGTFLDLQRSPPDVGFSSNGLRTNRCFVSEFRCHLLTRLGGWCVVAFTLLIFFALLSHFFPTLSTDHF